MTKFLSIIIIIFVVGFGGFFINEARKEIYFLCGNFSKDKPLGSVIEQLSTVKFSQFKILTLSNYKILRPESTESQLIEDQHQLEYQYLILLQSPFTFFRSNCQIYFQSDEDFDIALSGEIPTQQISFQAKLPKLVVSSSKYQGLL